MSIEIRPERPGDETAIDAVNSRAFGQMGEPNLVRLMRTYYPCFDRSYSLTAWDGEQMVGHTLMAPGSIRLMGQAVPALMVGPVAVVPERQRRGIGAAMMQVGHEQGRRDGFALAALYGHPTYYPRLGYRTCFGVGKVTLDSDALPQPSQVVRPWPVRPADIPWLMECFATEWADVDFAWLRGSAVSEWDIPGVDAALWRTEDGRPAAYVAGGHSGRMVIGQDPALVGEVLYTVRPESLDQHPAGWLARNVLCAGWGRAEVEASDAAMACELQEGVLEPCLRAVEAGERLPGYCPWPLALNVVA